jgi:hypothetical protein
MKRRAILALWPSLAGGFQQPAASPEIGKRSTRSEIAEYALRNDRLDLGGRAPESKPDESENCQQAQER